MKPIEVVKVISPELELNNVRRYTSVKGSLVTSAQTFTTPNPTSSSIQITCTPPSQNIAISRHVLKAFTYQVTITGTNTSLSPTLLQPGFVAPRAWPIMSTTVSESMTINNTTVTQSPANLYWPAFMWYADKFDTRNGQYSLTPSSLDKFQNYSEGIGSSLNPLLGYGQSAYELGRGAAVGFAITTNGATGAVVQITAIEPLLLSPFAFGEEAYTTPALIGVNNMTYYATLGNINRVISLIANQGIVGINITNVSVQVLSAALEFTYLTPDPFQNIPKHLVSSYYSVVDFPTQSQQTFAPGQSFAIPMSSIQLNGIPKRIVVFAGNNSMVITNDTIGALSDTFLSFAQTSPIVMTWNNNQFFSSYTQEQLFDLSVSNGYIGSFPQWAGRVVSGVITGGHVGSVLVIEFGKDVGLGPDEAPGKQGNYQLQINANFTNTNALNNVVNPTLHCVVIYEGVFSVSNGACSADINILNGENILQAQTLPNVKYAKSKDVYGGLFEGFANVLSQVPEFLRNTKLLSTVASIIPDPIAQTASPILATLGYGKKKKRAGALVGGEKVGGKKGGKKGGALVGGRKAMQQRIRGAGLRFVDESDEDADTESSSEQDDDEQDDE